jgi:hypothetical protein
VLREGAEAEHWRVIHVCPGFDPMTEIDVDQPGIAAED